MFRWFVLLILVAALTTSAVHRRQARRDGETIRRREEGGLLLVGRLLFALPLFVSIVAYIVHPPWVAWASIDIPGWMRWAAVGIAVFSLPLLHWVLRTLGRNLSETILTKDEHELVVTGPYRWIRHPLYTVGLLLVGALGIVAANGAILLLAVLLGVFIRYVVLPREERELIDRFGTKYIQYRQRTGAMLPSVW